MAAIAKLTKSGAVDGCVNCICKLPGSLDETCARRKVENAQLAARRSVFQSTYCAAIMNHCENIGRSAHLVNLDPAAEEFAYKPAIDIRDLVTLEDVMEELQFGPNGGLIYCMEFLLNNVDWLEEELGNYEDDYLIFDCPGQIELYTHFPIMRRVCDVLQRWNFRVCGVYLLESQFIEDRSKYFAGVMSAMSAMINLEIPHVNIMSKMDLLGPNWEDAGIEKYFDPDPYLLEGDVTARTKPKFHELNMAVVHLIEDFNIVSFLPLNINDEYSVATILSHVDNATQFGEDQEPRDPGLDMDRDCDSDGANG